MYCIRCKRTSGISYNGITENWLLIISTREDEVICSNHVISHRVPENTLLARPNGGVRHSIGLCPSCQLSDKQIANNYSVIYGDGVD